jgi:ABC-type transport system involved in multi-copper enzyme maturation permease subunit
VITARLNPVLARELRERARSRRTFIILTIALAVLASILDLIYTATRPSAGLESVFNSAALDSARNGRQIFDTMLLLILLLVCFLVPGLTAGSITGERERQTLVPLQVTLLKPRSIVLGKIASSLAFVVLMLIATTPLLAVSLILGGITTGAVAKGLLMIFATAILLACISVCISTLLRRSQSAVVLSYFATLMLLAGTLVIFGAQQVGSNQDYHYSNKAILVWNPAVALTDIVSSETDLALGSSGVTTPLSPLRELIRPTDSNFFGGNNAIRLAGGGPVPTILAAGPNGQVVVRPAVGAAFDGSLQQQAVDEGNDLGIRFWVRSLAAYALVSLTAVAIAARRLRTPSMRSES